MTTETTYPRVATTSRNDVPANYRKGARPTWHQSRRRNAVLGLLRGLRGTVLDYGCGYGDLAFAMSGDHDVCGVDLDLRRIEFARDEYAPLEFKQCTNVDVPYPDNRFDVVTSVVVLDFIADPECHFQAIRRVLKPGGHLILACQNEEIVRNAARAVFGRPPAKSLPGFYTRNRAEIRRLLQLNRFAVLKESWFYDPPFSGCKNVADVVFRSIEAALSALHISWPARYFLYLARIEK